MIRPWKTLKITNFSTAICWLQEHTDALSALQFQDTICFVAPSGYSIGIAYPIDPTTFSLWSEDDPCCLKVEHKLGGNNGHV